MREGAACSIQVAEQAKKLGAPSVQTLEVDMSDAASVSKLAAGIVPHFLASSLTHCSLLLYSLPLSLAGKSPAAA